MSWLMSRSKKSMLIRFDRILCSAIPWIEILSTEPAWILESMDFLISVRKCRLRRRAEFTDSRCCCSKRRREITSINRASSCVGVCKYGLVPWRKTGAHKQIPSVEILLQPFDHGERIREARSRAPGRGKRSANRYVSFQLRNSILS